MHWGVSIYALIAGMAVTCHHGTLMAEYNQALGSPQALYSWHVGLRSVLYK